MSDVTSFTLIQALRDTSLRSTMYEVIGIPPSSLGGDQDTSAKSTPYDTTWISSGADGLAVIQIKYITLCVISYFTSKNIYKAEIYISI